MTGDNTETEITLPLTQKKGKLKDNTKTVEDMNDDEIEENTCDVDDAQHGEYPFAF